MSCTQQSNEQPFVRMLTPNASSDLPKGTFRQYIDVTYYPSGVLFISSLDSSSNDETAKFTGQSNGTVMVVEYGSETPRILYFLFNQQSYSGINGLCLNGNLQYYWSGLGGPTTSLTVPDPPLNSIVKFDANKKYTFRLFNSLADAQKYLGITPNNPKNPPKKRTLEIVGIAVFVGAVILVVGGAFYYFSNKNNKNKTSTTAEGF